MQTIMVEDLKKKIDSGESVQLIDVRSPAEYLTSRIAGSQLVPITHFDQLAPSLDKQNKVYALCRSGRRAKTFCENLDIMGFDSVVIEGGIQKWMDQGYPVERSANVPWSIERQTRFGAGMFVFLGVVLGMTVHPGFFYFSGFVGLGLMVAGFTDFCGMAMMLEKMPWNRKIVNQDLEQKST